MALPRLLRKGNWVRNKSVRQPRRNIMCELEQKYQAEHPGLAAGQASQGGLYDRVMPAPPNSEAKTLADNAARWINQSSASLLNGEQFDQRAPHWYNLRGGQAMMGQAGWQFRSGFPTTGSMSLEDISNVMLGASKGQSRLQEVQGPPRVGDVVASAQPKSEIDLRHTCGLTASLGIVEPDGVIKLSAGRVVKTTDFFQQQHVKIFRPVP
jgi:hypothetical protein